MSLFCARCMRGWLVGILVAVSCRGALADGAPQPEITFARQVQVGNVFSAGEPVQLEAGVVSGEIVQWAICDFEGKTIESGTAAVREKRVRIAPQVRGVGYYVAKLVSRTGGQEKGEGTTSFAIVPPADIRKMPNSPFAVMSHFGKSMSPEVMPLIAKAGITSVRDECEWNGFEKKRGEFVTPPVVAAYMPKLAEAGIEPLMVLAFGNLVYFGEGKVPAHKAAPYDEAGYQAYVNYNLEVLKRFSAQVKTVEIWNEYNGTFCDGPAAANRPKYYTEMLRHSYEAIKTTYPQVKVVGGALVKIPLPYCEKLFKEGALRYMDAIAVHPYRATPEGVEKELAELSGLVKKYNQGKAKPIWVTETGSWRDSTPERADTAGYLVRMMTLMRTQSEVERIYWYLLCDYREFKTMGILRGADDPAGPFVPTMVYSAYANLIHLLYGAEFKAREETDARTRVYRFERGNDAIWVCWSTSAETKLRIAGSEGLRRVNLVGGEQPLTAEEAASGIVLGTRPIYLVGRREGARVAETPRPNRVVADSTEDFAGMQGKKNWSYHYYIADATGGGYEPAKAIEMKWQASKGDWDDLWQGPAPYLCLGEAAGEPSAKDGRQAWAVRRWTSTMEGKAIVTVSVHRGAAQGDGIVCKLFLDGKELASKRVLPQAREDFELPLELRKGAQVDFALTPGDGTDTSYDATAFHATVLVTSE